MAMNDMMCPYCGEMISQNAFVCRHCGRMLSGAPQQSADGAAYYRSAPEGYTGEEAARLRRKSRRALWAVILSVCGVFAAFAVLFGVLMFREFSGGEDFIDPSVFLPSEAGETLPEAVVPDSPDPESDPDVEALVTLAETYFNAVAENDETAVAALFPEAMRAEFGNDAKALLTEMDEHLDIYGADLTAWTISSMGEGDEATVAQLEATLPMGIERAVMMESEAEQNGGDPISVDLLAVCIGGQWYLYCSY